ncbi:hypothetical protein JCM21900_004194 [Sporobolomyces salmonicolor]
MMPDDRSSSTGSARSNERRLSGDGKPLDSAAYGVLNGTVGGSYGPFPSSFSPRRLSAVPRQHQNSAIGLDPPTLPYALTPPSGASDDELAPPRTASAQSIPRLEGVRSPEGPSSSLLWEKEPDDFLHSYDPELEKIMDKQFRSRFSWSSVINTTALVVTVVVIIGLFAGWPIYRYVIVGGFPMADSTMLSNSTGQVPQIPNLPGLIDKDTPQSAYTKTGFDGETYNLVFSDEFETEGRTFWPGDDPFWEAVDLHYWATTDLEWYDPDAITTKDGNLEITLSQEPIHDLNFRSGMLQSWNKFCFTGGHIEVNLSLPGSPTAQGLWPAVWTMGNLGRPGYGGSVDGMWPYSYDSCDVGTLPNQTWPNGTDPVAAKHSGSSDYGGELSWLVGQRASACTCPADADEHPGPSVNVGRGAPEIDILEGQIAANGQQGSASQSVQIAPFDDGYNWKNTTPYITVWDDSITTQNQWHGAVNQESMSLETLTDATSYEGAGWQTYGFEYDPGPDGRITWSINSNPTWELSATAIPPNELTQIGQRLISEEPMAIMLNLAISTKFQYPEWGKLTFPATLRIASVRVWQKGNRNVGCDPAAYPTSQYINNHLDLYTNPNITTFSQSNHTAPRNRLSANGCT